MLRQALKNPGLKIGKLKSTAAGDPLGHPRGDDEKSYRYSVFHHFCMFVIILLVGVRLSKFASVAYNRALNSIT